MDNILIDEARTPLIISGPAFSDVRRYAEADKIARQLAETGAQGPQELRASSSQRHRGRRPADARRPDSKVDPQNPPPKGVYFEIKEKERTCHLTDAGVREAEKLAGVESFYTAGNMEWPHLIDNALKAHHLYLRDRDYMIDPDPREQRAGDHHHRRAHRPRHVRPAVVATACTRRSRPSTRRTACRSSRRRRRSPRSRCRTSSGSTRSSAGMTGTAMTEANEFWKIYKLDVIAIPTNKAAAPRQPPATSSTAPTGRSGTRSSKEIEEIHETGRPILIGTTDVAKSEKLAGMLKRQGHQARAAERQAGERGPRGGDRRPGRPQGGGHDRHEHGRPRDRHHPRRQPGDDGLGPAQGQTDPLTRPARSARRRLEGDRRRHRGEGADEGGRPRDRRDGRAAHPRHRAARQPADRQPAPRPGRPPGRPRARAGSSCRSRTT